MEIHCKTGKKVYRTYYQADRENKKKIKQHGIKMKVYRCLICGFYHLTGHTREITSGYKYNRKTRRKYEVTE